jgi:hypothetical protein
MFKDKLSKAFAMNVGWSVLLVLLLGDKHRMETG